MVKGSKEDNGDDHRLARGNAARSLRTRRSLLHANEAASCRIVLPRYLIGWCGSLLVDVVLAPRSRIIPLGADWPARSEGISRDHGIPGAVWLDSLSGTGWVGRRWTKTARRRKRGSVGYRCSASMLSK